MNYEAFDLEVFDYRRQADKETFRVRVAASPAGEQGPGEAESVALTPGLRGQLDALADPDQQVDPVVIGRALGDLLFPPGARRLLERARARLQVGTALRIRLRLDSLELAAIPWEITWLPPGQERPATAGLAGFLVLDRQVSLVRYEMLGLEPEVRSPARNGKLRLVGVFASPQDGVLAPLDLEAERHSIAEALSDLRDVQTEFLLDGTVESLEQALIGEADVFHFSGHGTSPDPGDSPDPSSTGSGDLVFLDSLGGTRLFSADKLAILLRSRGIRLAFLGACNSGRREARNPWSGSAAALVRSGIPPVVGMQHDIANASATAFSRALYRTLAAGQPVDAAMVAGRQAMLNRSGITRHDWAVPVLYLRSDDGVLFPSQREVEPALATGRPAPLTAPALGAKELIGRDREVALGVRALRVRQAISVAGLGGIGKSTLVARIAQLVMEDGGFADGVCWIGDLESSSLEAICDAVARRLGDDRIPAMPNGDKPDALRDLLASKDLLLVLDGVTEPGVVRRFLARCRPPNQALAVTSVQRQAGFDLEIALGPLDPEPAAGLFVAALGESASPDLVASICKAVAYHPLAIKIVASRAATEGITLDRLVDRLRDDRKRIRTLRASDVGSSIWESLQASFDSLDSATRSVAVELAACFGGHAGLDVLARLGGLDELDCEDALGQLVVRVLAERTGDRFRMPMLVRDFAGDAYAGDVDAARRRAIDTLLAYVSDYSDDRPQHYDRLEQELANLVGAVRYASAQGLWQAAQDLAHGLTRRMLLVRGYWSEQIEIGTLGMAAADVTGDRRAWARLAHNTGVALQKQGRLDEARALYSQSLAISRSIAELSDQAKTLHQLGRVSQDEGHLDAARSLYEESLAIKRGLADQAGEAATRHQLGLLAQEQGDLMAARGHYLASLAVEQELRNDHGIARTQFQLATLADAEGESVTAHELYRACLEAYEALGDQEGIGLALLNLGLLESETGTCGKADVLLRQSLAILDRLQKPDALLARMRLRVLELSADRFSASSRPGGNPGAAAGAGVTSPGAVRRVG